MTTTAIAPDLTRLRYPSWQRAARALLARARRGPVPLADALSIGGLTSRSASRVVEHLRAAGLLSMGTCPDRGVVLVLGPSAASEE